MSKKPRGERVSEWIRRWRRWWFESRPSFSPPSLFLIPCTLHLFHRSDFLNVSGVKVRMAILFEDSSGRSKGGGGKGETDGEGDGRKMRGKEKGSIERNFRWKERVELERSSRRKKLRSRIGIGNFVSNDNFLREMKCFPHSNLIGWMKKTELSHSTTDLLVLPLLSLSTLNCPADSQQLGPRKCHWISE